MTKFREYSKEETIRRILKALPEINPSFVKVKLEKNVKQSYSDIDIFHLITKFERELYDERK